MLKVFLVEDEFVVREGIKNNIDWSSHGYDFCGEAGDGEVAYSMIQKLKPDIVITDIKMPFMDGITLSRMIKSEFPWIEIIILTGYEDFQFAREAIKIGVSCYLLKPVNGESIMKEVDALSEKIREKKAEREAAQRYEEEMRERTELDKRDYFNTLVKGGKSTSELLAEAKDLSIDISALRYNIMLLKIWSDKHDIGEYSNSVLRVEEEVRKIAEKTDALFFDFKVEGTALLFKGDDDKDIEKKIRNAIDQMTALFAGYKHIRYFGAVGQPVGRLSEIHTSFDWASRAYAHLYLTSENAFLYGSKEGLRPEEITEETLSRHLTTSFMPDPDLLIRTGGELRISNYLLWQCAYTEFYFTDEYWPDFTADSLHRAVEEYQKRQRRYGKTGDQITNEQ